LLIPSGPFLFWEIETMIAELPRPVVRTVDGVKVRFLRKDLTNCTPAVCQVKAPPSMKRTPFGRSHCKAHVKSPRRCWRFTFGTALCGNDFLAWLRLYGRKFLGDNVDWNNVGYDIGETHAYLVIR
jgi:hypothetical protein